MNKKYTQEEIVDIIDLFDNEFISKIRQMRDWKQSTIYSFQTTVDNEWGDNDDMEIEFAQLGIKQTESEIKVINDILSLYANFVMAQIIEAVRNDKI